MAWLAVDGDGGEQFFDECPRRQSLRDNSSGYWLHGDEGFPPPGCHDGILLPSGTILNMIGRSLTWEDNPFEVVDVLVHLNSIDGSFAYVETLDEYHARQEVILKHQIGELGDIGQLMIGNEVIRFAKDDSTKSAG